MQEYMFAVTKFDKEPSAAAVRRCEKAIKALDEDVKLITAGYPAVTDCKFQAWCVAPEWGNASNYYRGEVQDRFIATIKQHLG